MESKKEENFYLIETVLNDSQYLCKVINDDNSHRPLIHGTSRNIHDKDIMKFKNLESAKKVCRSLEKDIHSNNPRVLRVSVKTSIREVE